MQPETPDFWRRSQICLDPGMFPKVALLSQYQRRTIIDSLLARILAHLVPKRSKGSSEDTFLTGHLVSAWTTPRTVRSLLTCTVITTSWCYDSLWLFLYIKWEHSPWPSTRSQYFHLKQWRSMEGLAKRSTFTWKIHSDQPAAWEIHNFKRLDVLFLSLATLFLCL